MGNGRYEGYSRKRPVGDTPLIPNPTWTCSIFFFLSSESDWVYSQIQELIEEAGPHYAYQITQRLTKNMDKVRKALLEINIESKFLVTHDWLMRSTWLSATALLLRVAWWWQSADVRHQELLDVCFAPVTSSARVMKFVKFRYLFNVYNTKTTLELLIITVEFKPIWIDHILLRVLKYYTPNLIS